MKTQKQRKTEEIKTAKGGNKKSKEQKLRIEKGMCKLSLLFMVFCLFVILVSLMSDIKRQRNCFFFSLSPNFVYSVIINQSGCMTAFRAQTDTKDMWRG